MAGSLLETLPFGKQSQTSKDVPGFKPTSMRDFLKLLHNPEAFGNINTDGTLLQIQPTTWQQFVTNVALHPNLGLNLHSLESTFNIHPADMEMTELGHDHVLGLVGALGTNYHLDDASLVVALDLRAVGYDLPERHQGEDGIVRPMHLYVCGLTTSNAPHFTQRILLVTYELAALRPKTLPHQIGANCEAIEFAISTHPPNTLTLEELGIQKGMKTAKSQRREALPHSTRFPIDGSPIITEYMRNSVPGQTQMVYGTIVRQANSFQPRFLGPKNIQVFPGTPENNNQVHILTGYQSRFFFPAFLEKVS
ncbi:MAG: hypothetical protein COS89_09155 [Deltaproteobacteria bacterium CG07_land_8_20_14_0_80_38_7]|nr:MAG: hypothetical protein COS89_09155 [Deltaproteobacteria bacterium CG07_land_8_20_14_0_80_38_7]